MATLSDNTKTSIELPNNNAADCFRKCKLVNLIWHWMCR